MKTKLILLGLVVCGMMNAQTYYEIVDLQNQNTYDSAYYVMADKVGEDSTKKIALRVVAPKVKDETAETSTLDKDATVLRISDNASNNEYKATLRLVNPDIADLSSDISLTTSDHLTFYDAASTIDKRIQYSFFITDLTTEATFQSAINTDIDNRVTESFILNLVQTDTTFSFTYGSPTRDGSMTLVKNGDQVNGYITLDYGETTNSIFTTSNGLGGTFLPEVNTLVVNEDGLNVMLYSDGTIKLKDTRSGDYSSGYEDGSTDINYSVSYITN